MKGKSKISVFNIKGESTKYGNKWCIIDGIKFQSIREGNFYLHLKSEKMRGKIKDFKRQVPFKILINDILVCTYYADFVVIYPDGRREVIDVKGFKTETYKLKKKMVFAYHGIKIIEK